MSDFEFFDIDDLNNLLKDDEIFLSLKETHPANPSKKYVPEYQFSICIQDNKKTAVGRISLRIDNSELTKYSGNIGYNVSKEYRGHKYSLKAVKLALKLAKKHNLKYITITCDPENIASNKICNLAGGKLIETANIPESHEMYQQGFRKANIYKIDL